MSISSQLLFGVDIDLGTASADECKLCGEKLKLDNRELKKGTNVVECKCGYKNIIGYCKFGDDD